MAGAWHSSDKQNMDHITSTTRKGVVNMGLGDRCQQTIVRMVSHMVMWPTEHDGTMRWLISCNFLKVVFARTTHGPCWHKDHLQSAVRKTERTYKSNDVVELMHVKQLTWPTYSIWPFGETWYGKHYG